MRFTTNQCSVVFLAGIVAVGLISFASAQTANEIQGKISTTNDQLQKLNQEITATTKTLDSLGTQKSTLNTAIKGLDLTKKKLDTDIKITQIHVDTTNQTISQLGSQISERQKEIDARLAAIREAIHVIYERDAATLPQIALSDESFSGLWDDLEAIDKFNIQVANNIDQLKVLKTDLEHKTAQKNVEKKNLLVQKASLSDQKAIAEATKTEKARLLAQTKSQESVYKKLLNQKLALKNILETDLRDYESKLKFILDPTSIPPRRTKVFALPIDGLRIPQDITQQFGRTVDSVRLYTSGTHDGTDFRATVGTPVHAMLSGTVIGTGNTDLTCPGASYGKWVLIKHNNGLASLYAHFSLVRVSMGQVVNTGDLIGYSGNTGYSTGPHLHLTVLAAAAVSVQSLPSKACTGRVYTMPVAALNAYLNPMDYL